MSTTTQSPAVDDLYDDDDDYQVTPPNQSRRGKRVTSGLILLAVVGLSFWGGVYMQKNHGSTSTSGGATAARGNFAATGAVGFNRTGTGSGTGTGATRTGSSSSATGGSAASGTTGQAGGGFGGGTNGTVTLVDGTNIYVTTTDGNVVKVATSSTSTFSKTETGKITDVKPGDTVAVRGSTADDGTVAATTVSIGSTTAP